MLSAVVGDWRPGFSKAYALQAGEMVKAVRSPWIPERDGFYHDECGQPQYDAIPAGPLVGSVFA